MITCAACGGIPIGTTHLAARLHRIAEHGWPTASLTADEVRDLVFVAKNWGTDVPDDGSYEAYLRLGFAP